MEQKTHWKTLSPLSSTYLGGHDLDDGNGGYRKITPTIKSVSVKEVIGAKGRKTPETVIEWAENIKPFIVNKTNAKIIAKVLNTPYIEDWANHQIELHFDTTIKFGNETTGGIRVSPKRIQVQVEIKCESCSKDIQDFVTDSGQVIPASVIAQGSKKTYGKTLCYDCSSKAKGDA